MRRNLSPFLRLLRGLRGAINNVPFPHVAAARDCIRLLQRLTSLLVLSQLVPVSRPEQLGTDATIHSLSQS